MSETSKESAPGGESATKDEAQQNGEGAPVGETEPKKESEPQRSDYLTVIALSVLAFTLAVLLHEHLGHATACVLLGGHPSELSAFYINCQYGNMPDLSIRLEVALAGPLVSLIAGLVGQFAFKRLQGWSAQGKYVLWLFSTISLMNATGYLLFSGISGLGDFGTSRDGVLYQIQPELIWRIVFTLAGILSYLLVIALSLRWIDTILGGSGGERVVRAQRLSLTSYITGALYSVLVGLLNPYGILIVLISSAASSIGGTSGLAWMMMWLNRKKSSTVPGLEIKRSWGWIAAGFGVGVLYAVILGPTIRM